eukprot:382405-Rhodomonas_salina.1
MSLLLSAFGSPWPHQSQVRAGQRTPHARCVRTRHCQRSRRIPVVAAGLGVGVKQLARPLFLKEHRVHRHPDQHLVRYDSFGAALIQAHVAAVDQGVQLWLCVSLHQPADRNNVHIDSARHVLGEDRAAEWTNTPPLHLNELVPLIVELPDALRAL